LTLKVSFDNYLAEFYNINWFCQLPYNYGGRFVQIYSVQNQQTLRFNNCKTVLNIIRDNQATPISRADIAKETFMSPTSITRITADLIDLGIVKQAETFSKGVGRRATQLRIVSDAVLSLGLFIDKDFLRMCVIDCMGKVLDKACLCLEDQDYNPEEIIQLAKGMYDEMCTKGRFDSNKVKVLGIGCVGNVDNKSGYVFFAPQMGWEKIDLRYLAEETFKMPIYIDNDLKMALIGTTFNSDEMKKSDVSIVTIGVGVGVSVMYNGKLVRGISNAAGEVGHTIFKPNGRLCVCGRMGCLASYLTEVGMVEICKSKGYRVKSFKDIVEAYNNGEDWAIKEIDAFTSNIATFLGNMIYTYNTKYLLVIGSIIENYQFIYDLSFSKIKDSIHDNLYSDVIIKRISNPYSAAMGAAYTAQSIYIENMIKTYINSNDV